MQMIVLIVYVSVKGTRVTGSITLKTYRTSHVNGPLERGESDEREEGDGGEATSFAPSLHC